MGGPQRHAAADRVTSGSGEMSPGAEIALAVDQTLTQDATGTMVMLELEALGLDRVRPSSRCSTSTTTCCRPTARTPTTTCSCAPPATVRPVVLQARQRCLPSGPHAALRVPGRSGRLGQPHVRGRLARHAGYRRRAASRSRWRWPASRCTCACRRSGASAHRRAAGVGVGQGRDPGDAAPPRCQGRRQPDHRVPRCRPGALTAMDRHVIANMGAELGATTTVFPADEAVRRSCGRGPRARLR